MFARRPVARATGDPKLGHFSLPGAVIPIEAGLRFHVVAKDTVHVPLRDMLVVVAAVGREKRAVEMHPAFLDKIVGDRGAIPRVAGLGQILLDPAGTDGADDFELLGVAIHAGHFHPILPVMTQHLGANALIGDRVVAVEIAHDTVGTRFLGHGAMIGGGPGRVIGSVTFPAITRLEITGVDPSLSDRGVIRRDRPKHGGDCDQREDGDGPGEKGLR